MNCGLMIADCGLATGFENVDGDFFLKLLVAITASVMLANGVKRLFFASNHTERISPLPLPIEITKRFATIEALEKVEIDFQNQLKEMRTYMHEMVHDIRNDIQRLTNSGELGREGIHDRINALVEITFEMRGLLRQAGAREEIRHPGQNG